MLKAMAAPYGAMRFMPTGGIDGSNILSYLQFDKILCCGGSFMVKDDLIKAGDWATITELTRGAVRSMLGFEFAHIGINTESKEEAERAAKLFDMMFGMPVRETSKSYFAGNSFELMMKKGPGKFGHIGIKTNFVDRAIAYFERLGFEFDADSITYADNGKPKFAYFKEEIAGFAVHIVAK